MLDAMDLASNGTYTYPTLAGTSQALWVSFHIEEDATAGTYQARVEAGSQSIEISVEVLQATIPRTDDSKAYGTSFEMTLDGGDLARLYGNGSGVTPWAVKQQWAQYAQAHRTPADQIYRSTPRDPQTLEYLARLGARHLNLIDV